MGKVSKQKTRNSARATSGPTDTIRDTSSPTDTIAEIMKNIKSEFIQQFTNSGNVESIKEYGIGILKTELRRLGMSEEDININSEMIIDELNALVDKLIIEAADKIHSCSRTGCSEKGVAGTCGKCKKAYYCSKECQLEDWKTHKKKCKKRH